MSKTMRMAGDKMKKYQGSGQGCMKSPPDYPTPARGGYSHGDGKLQLPLR